MNTYQVKGGLTTPQIEGNIEKGTLSISGKSLPEDTKTFYEPLIHWLQSFYQSPAKNIEIIFDIDYYNTSTSNLFTQMLKKFSVMSETRKVKVMWIYEQDDLEMREIGEDYQNLFGPFIELLPKENSTQTDSFKPIEFN